MIKNWINKNLGLLNLAFIFLFAALWIVVDNNDIMFQLAMLSGILFCFVGFITLSFQSYSKYFKPTDIEEVKSRSERKIILKISPKALLATMIDFFERNDVVLNNDKENRIRRFIINVFDFNSKYSFSSSAEGTINFLNFEAREKLCYLIMLLKNSNSIEYKSLREIYLALINELKESNPENIGLGKVTMKNLFYEINKNPQLLKSIPKQIGYSSYSFFKSTLQNTK